MSAVPAQLGPRPYWLVDEMRPSTLEAKLKNCARNQHVFHTSDFSIGHRGACLQFPEHTIESYKAAIRQGAGIVECDVTFTKDLQLVCRHAQCDLHTTTDVLIRPELAAKCKVPFAANMTTEPVCCTSDFTLAEIKTLCAKMDSRKLPIGQTPQGYIFGGTADWRTDLYQSGCPSVPTHMESLLLLQAQSVKFTPELKTPEVPMPFGSYTQENFAQALVNDYVMAGVEPNRVWLQSFLPSDVFYWVKNTAFGRQAVALDGNDAHNITETMAWLDAIKAGGGKIVAPPMQRLIVASNTSKYGATESPYSIAAKARGLGIITWTIERSPPGLSGYYYTSTFGQGVYTNDGDMYNVLYVLAFTVGVRAIFSDWPATVTFFANCFDLNIRRRRPLSSAP